MATQILQAKSAHELRDVLELRYDILTDSGQKLGKSTQFTRRVIDHLDVYPDTFNFVAYQKGKSVGCLRSVVFNANDDFINLVFDFRETASNIDGTSCLLDMLAVKAAFSDPRSLFKFLIKMALNVLAHKGIDNAFFVCPKPVIEIVESLGFRRLKDPYYSDVLRQDVCPVAVSVTDFFTQLTASITDKEILRFQEVFYYTIFEPGEVMVIQGEKGSTAYLIEEGDVDVVLLKGEELISISSIGAGQMIGEIAMVTNETRTASLIAKSPTTCISFDRQDFMRLMYDQPHRSIDIFKIFSKRLSESNKKLAELKR